MSTGTRKAFRRLLWAILVLFVIVFAIGAANLVFTTSQASINRCQRIENTRFQQTEIDRAIATKASAQAQIDLWNALLALHGTQEQKLSQFNHDFSVYKATLHQVTAIKFPPETRSCG